MTDKFFAPFSLIAHGVFDIESKMTKAMDFCQAVTAECIFYW